RPGAFLPSAPRRLNFRNPSRAQLRRLQTGEFSWGAPLPALARLRIKNAMNSTLQPLIIAVDDEADDIFFLRHALQKAGMPHQFQAFSNGEAAMVALAAYASGEMNADLPLVCFLDIKMVGLTGFDVLKWIRAQKALDTLPV